jgi:heme exporter protein D
VIEGMFADLGRHAGFIIASYAATALILGGLGAFILLDYRAAKARLAALDAGRGPKAGDRA